MKRYVKSSLKFLLKAGLTAFALWFTFRGIDRRALADVWADLSWFFVVLSLLTFLLAKVVESWRQNVLYRDVGIRLGYMANFRLHLLGMFYNLFLPGGIGGDAYKVYWIRTQQEIPVKSIIQATLVNRLNGLTALLLILSLSIVFISLEFPYKNWIPLASLLWVAGYAIAVRWLFPAHIRSTAVASLLSFTVHGIQTLSVICILYAIEIQTGLFDYWYVFMVSNIAVVIPISIGGFGIRELVFKEAAGQLGMNPAFAVSVGLLFNLVRSLVSFVGAYYLLLPHKVMGKE